MNPDLRRFFGVEHQSPGDIDFDGLIDSTAHIVMDVQAGFCNPHVQGRGTPHTGAAATRIAAIKDEFAALGIATYVVYYDRENHGIDKAYGGLYKIAVAPGDHVVRKWRDDAFEGSADPDGLNLENLLFVSARRRFFLSGFFASTCCTQTARGGLARKFSVCAVTDGLGDQGCYDASAEDCLKTGVSMMRDAGGVAAASGDVLEFFKSLRQPA